MKPPESPAKHASYAKDASGPREALIAALGLIASGRVVRECGVQIRLIDLLCGAGADPERAKTAALLHGEFDAVDALLRHGMKMDLPTAAALGRSATRRTVPRLPRHRLTAV